MGRRFATRIKKPRSLVVSAAPEPPVPEAHSVVVCARRQSPRARAFQQGRHGFGFDSKANWRRTA